MEHEAHIHVGVSPYIKPGTVEVIVAPQDYTELKAFFEQHFKVVKVVGGF